MEQAGTGGDGERSYNSRCILKVEQDEVMDCISEAQEREARRATANL